MKLGLALVSVLATAAPAFAAPDPVVVAVPYAAQDYYLPHPAHEGARITLKAILRNATCGTGYRVWWDVDLDGNYDEETFRDVTATSGMATVYDLGRTIEIGDVSARDTVGYGVRVRDKCTNRDVFGTYRVEIFDWRLSGDPVAWTSEQVSTSAAIALDELLWFIHRQLRSYSGTDSAMSASLQRASTTGLAVRAFADAGYLPAYRPGTINDYGRALPVGFLAANDDRWNNDPYAETMTRMANLVLATGTATVPVPAAEEASTCGYNIDGSERSCTAISGSRDLRGAYTGGANNDVYQQGVYTGSLATLLPAFGGTPVQAGALRGTSWELLIQQLADYLGAMQYDGGCAKGGWYYTDFNGSGDCVYADASTTQWAFFGLEGAETIGKRNGVFINNRHKYRVAEYLITNQRADGGGAYRTSYAASNFQLSGGALMGARWLNIHNMAPGSTTKPYLPHAQLTEGAMRTAYDRYLSFTRANWASTNRVGSVGWTDRLWQAGSYLCGDRANVYGAPACGNTYAIYSHRRGYLTGLPALERVGDLDWMREFGIYYARAQARSIADYTSFGRVTDSFCDPHSVVCNQDSPRLSSVMAALVLGPMKWRRTPLAVAQATPTVVVEGCAGGNAGRVTLDASDSMHRDPRGALVRYDWDADRADGLWWETGRAPDFTANDPRAFEYQYQRRGDYIATLRVTDDGTPGLVSTATVAVRVDAAGPQPPTCSHGGPYVVQYGAGLQLAGSVSDPNAGCGDILTAGWDLDNDGQFDDGMGASAGIPWNTLSNLPVGEALPIRLRATDSSGASTTVLTSLTIFPADPVARFSAAPNPAACGQIVAFHAGTAYHPNPSRQVVSYLWDVDGDGAFDGGGASPDFTHAYSRFGTYDAALRVTDDQGRSADAHLEVEVNRGNHAPIARLPNEIVLVEGSDLRLDGSACTDADVPCGDRITSFQWDVGGDGRFDGPTDAAGVQVVIPWAVIRDRLPWPGETGITIQVTDSLGGTSSASASLQIVRAAPVVAVEQFPNPASIRLDTGRAEVTLDARGSHSSTPGGSLLRIEWDLNDDGTFELRGPDQVQLEKVFQPVPAPDAIPPVFVRARVYDQDGRVAETRYPVSFHLPPTPPTADADPGQTPEDGYHISEGEGVVLDASHSVDPDAEVYGDAIETYRWDIASDDPSAPVWDIETDEPILELDAEDLAELGITEPGEYHIVLEVQDTMGVVATDVTTITVHPAQPSGSLEGPATAAPGEPVTFDASGSEASNPDAEIVEYAWDLDNDGQFDDATGPEAEHVFTEYTFGEPAIVAVRITDSDGNQTVIEHEVEIAEGDSPPAAVAGGPYSVATGDDLIIDPRGSSDPDAPQGDAIVRVSVDVGADGDAEATSNTVEPIRLTWNQLQQAGVDGPGRYDVAVTVEDRFGETSTMITTIVVGTDPTAVAAARPGVARCDGGIRLDGSACVPGGPGAPFEVVRWEWDLDNDGQYDDATGRVIDHHVTTPEQFTVGLKVTDRGGRSDEGQIVVPVAFDNTTPVAVPGGPYRTGFVGQDAVAVHLDGRSSFDPDGICDELTSYRWDLDGDGQYDDAVGARIEYENPNWHVGNEQPIALQVCDANGACSAAGRTTIIVGQEAPPSGEIMSPRPGLNDCVGPLGADMVVRCADPEGDVVTAIVLIDGREVTRTEIDTPDNGSAVDAHIALGGQVATEGTHHIQVRLEDGEGGFALFDAGGAITFDRTAPVVELLTPQDVCYAAGAERAVEIRVTDGLDDSPVVVREEARDTCHRVVTITATDACGNAGQAIHNDRVARHIGTTINGAAEGELVARGTGITWTLDSPADCLSGAPVSIMYDDAGAQSVYVAGTPVQDPGTHTLRLALRPCAGAEQVVFRRFEVNAPPVAAPVTDEHRAESGGAATYTIDEGGSLWLDASDSQSPEAGDDVRYQWDIDGDGDFDAEGERVQVPANTNGSFQGRLRVCDQFGECSEAGFRIDVRDSVPVPHAGGPYEVAQGASLALDGSASLPGSAADPIREYEWSFGDGTPAVAGGNLSRTEHTWAEDGAYTVRLIVRDEDGQRDASVRVDVRDVNPVVSTSAEPQDPAEMREHRFAINAVPGAPGDPLRKYEWAIDYDFAHPIAVGADVRELRYAFRDAGHYTMTVKVSDDDSFSVHAFDVDVRETTLGELIDDIANNVNRLRGNGQTSPFVIDELDMPGDPRRVEDLLRDAAWGERHGFRGNTLQAMDALTMVIAFSQMEGADFGELPWAIARQLRREISETRSEVVSSERFIQSSVDRADQLIERFESEMDDGDFARDVNRENPLRLRGIVGDATQAYFQLSNAVDACNMYGEFELDTRYIDPVRRVQQATEVNERVIDALDGMSQKMQRYIDTGVDNNDTGPGRSQMRRAVDRMGSIFNRLNVPIGIVCQQGACITDEEALRLEVDAMDLVGELTESAEAGVWVRNWQVCLVKAVKFRIELSMLRVEYSCGANIEMVRRARQRQREGEAILAEGRLEAALEFYARPEQRCLLIEVYNECLVPAYPFDNVPVETPAHCE